VIWHLFGNLSQTEKLSEIQVPFGQTVQTALSEQLPEQSKAEVFVGCLIG
jgi:hypothetical protein